MARRYLDASGIVKLARLLPELPALSTVQLELQAVFEIQHQPLQLTTLERGQQRTDRFIAELLQGTQLAQIHQCIHRLLAVHGDASRQGQALQQGIVM